MKVLDLRCSNDHRFEGWFASEDDYRSQLERGLLDCPLCSDHAITRLPSAPRLNVSKPAVAAPTGRAVARDDARTERSANPSSSPSTASPHGITPAQMQAGWMNAVRHVLAHTEDVGPRFAEEARRIHHGETEERAIRGQATKADAEALRDEGIEVVSMAVPDALKSPLQ